MNRFFRNLLICIVISAQVVIDLFAQGAAVPKRPDRPPPQVKLDRPIPKIQFEDIAANSGLTSRHTSGGEREKNYIIETTGSGVALFDYDNDGWLDIFLLNGTTFSGVPKGQTPTNHLYRNNRNGKFFDVTEKAGLVSTGWGQGVCTGDYDNDGNEDLFVTYWGQNTLSRNNGNGTFTNVTEKSGLASEKMRYGSGCAFLDYDKDGLLDLFVANYVDLDLQKTPSKGSNQYCVWKATPVMCGPRGLPAPTNLLYRGVKDSNGAVKFVEVSEKTGIAKVTGRYAFTPVVSDFDNDGWPDIYVACDSTPSILYHNNGDGSFSDIGLLSGSAVNEDGQEQAGMGVAAGDYNRDGFIDLVKTNFADDTPTLYRNNKDGSFTDVTYPSRLGVNTQFLGWGVCFFDFDCDGWKDIFMANGHVYPEVDALAGKSPYKQERLLFWNLGNGTFADLSSQAGSGIAERRVSRGAAAGDLDNDGSLEIVVNNMNDTPSLLKNSGEKQNWIMFKLNGKQSNRSGIGARVRVVAGDLIQIDEVRSGGSYISQNDLRLHFGIGKARGVDRVEVIWPSGRNEAFGNLKANRIVILEEGNGTVIKK
jgi:enediyne biosynthesis protein E4